LHVHIILQPQTDAVKMLLANHSDHTLISKKSCTRWDKNQTVFFKVCTSCMHRGRCSI